MCEEKVHSFLSRVPNPNVPGLFGFLTQYLRQIFQVTRWNDSCLCARSLKPIACRWPRERESGQSAVPSRGAQNRERTPCTEKHAERQRERLGMFRRDGDEIGEKCVKNEGGTRSCLPGTATSCMHSLLPRPQRTARFPTSIPPQVLTPCYFLWEGFADLQLYQMLRLHSPKTNCP